MADKPIGSDASRAFGGKQPDSLARSRGASKNKGLREAVNRHCKSCIYDPTNGGTWRQQVEACTVTTCELYPYRPLGKPRKRGANPADRA